MSVKNYNTTVPIPIPIIWIRIHYPCPDPGLCYQKKKKIIKNNFSEKQFYLKINLFLNFKKIMALEELFNQLSQ